MPKNSSNRKALCLPVTYRTIYSVKNNGQNRVVSFCVGAYLLSRGRSSWRRISSLAHLYRHDWQMPIGICSVLSVKPKWLEACRDNTYIHTNTKQHPVLLYGVLLCVSIYLLSRVASNQVSSARVSLTAVFGMGTGVPSPSSILTRT